MPGENGEASIYVAMFEKLSQNNTYLRKGYLFTITFFFFILIEMVFGGEKNKEKSGSFCNTRKKIRLNCLHFL